MIDTHCHLTFEKLADRLDEVFAHAQEQGVDRMITVATSPENSHQSVILAEKYQHVFATAGLHPCYAGDALDEKQVRETLTQLADHPKVVAFGEMGLDKHWPEPTLDIQIPAFEWQLDTAKKFPQMPIIIHNRKATDQTLDILKNSQIPGERFVFHCFTGEPDEFKKILNFGAMISFTGVCTFKSAQHLAQCATQMPIDRLMIETDSPYLTPEPFRKIRPNQPGYVRQIAQHLASLRQMPLEKFTEILDANAMRFFKKII